MSFTVTPHLLELLFVRNVSSSDLVRMVPLKKWRSAFDPMLIETCANVVEIEFELT